MKSGANPPPDRRLWAACLLIAAASLALRIPLLEPRPMHTDEAVHACLLGEMLAGHPYAYNPGDFHGPALYFLAEPILRLLGVRSLATMEAWQLRLIPALAWSALILVLPLLRAGLGRVGVIAAAGLLTLAAPFVYFSTDFIHESLFLLATIFSLAAGARFLTNGAAQWAVAFGAGLGVMIATKETVVLTFVAAAVAFIAAGAGPSRVGRDALLRGLAIAAACAVVVAGLFFSSFGQNPDGVRDLIGAAGNFTARATGQGHEKPWWTYLDWTFWPTVRATPFSGWVLMIAAVAGVWLGRRRPLVRFLGIFGVTLGVIYSAIPYKTPWLMLNYLVPFALAAGAGAQEVYARWPRARGALVVIGLGCIALLAQESWRQCVRFPIDPANPLAYAASSMDGKRLAGRVDALMAGHADDVVQVISADAWPLPWLLRKTPRVGYWKERPAAVEGRLLIASPELAGDGFPSYRPAGIYGLRPEILACLFVREEIP